MLEHKQHKAAIHATDQLLSQQCKYFDTLHFVKQKRCYQYVNSFPITGALQSIRASQCQPSVFGATGCFVWRVVLCDAGHLAASMGDKYHQKWPSVLSEEPKSLSD